MIVNQETLKKMDIESTDCGPLCSKLCSRKDTGKDLYPHGGEENEIPKLRDLRSELQNISKVLTHVTQSTPHLSLNADFRLFRESGMEHFFSVEESDGLI